MRVPARPQQVKRKSVDQLVAILKSHPGGTQALAAATRGGSRITPPNPGAVGGLKSAEGTFAVTLDRDRLKLGNNTAALLRVDVTNESTYRLNKAPPLGSVVMFNFAYPKNGW